MTGKSVVMKAKMKKEIVLNNFYKENYVSHLEEFKIPEVLRIKTDKAFKKFSELPLPDNKMEEWRRTDISRLPFDNFEPLNSENLKYSNHLEKVSGRIKILNEHTDVALDPGLKNKGVIFDSIFPSVIKHSELVAKYFDVTRVSHQNAKFQTWNTAFFNRGVFLFIPDDIVIEKPFEIIIDGNLENKALLLRNLFIIGQNSRSLIKIIYQGSGISGPLLSISTDEVFAAANSNLEIVAVQNLAKDDYSFANGASVQSRDSNVNWTNIVMGSKIHKSFTGGELKESGAHAYLNGAYFAEKKQHMDMRTMQIHNAPHTDSDLLFKGAVKDRAHTIYQGMIQVANGSQMIDAYQTNKNLILNEGARADSIPGLEILADDVSCSHGATVGHIDPEEIFYLQSRGIDEEQARKIIIAGFFEDVVSRIHDEDAKEFIRSLIDEKIGKN